VTIGENRQVRISAKAEYAIRATVELAASGGGPLKCERISERQDISAGFLENILGSLRIAGIVGSRRGYDGGYWLARPADEVTLAEVIRAVDGPLATVRGTRPEAIRYEGPNESLRDVWLALRAQIRSVLERVTIADVASSKLPPEVLAMIGSDAD
jgi:Rrf2 family protein